MNQTGKIDSNQMFRRWMSVSTAVSAVIILAASLIAGYFFENEIVRHWWVMPVGMLVLYTLSKILPLIWEKDVFPGTIMLLLGALAVTVILLTDFVLGDSQSAIQSRAYMALAFTGVMIIQGLVMLFAVMKSYLGEYNRRMWKVILVPGGFTVVGVGVITNEFAAPGKNIIGRNALVLYVIISIILFGVALNVFFVGRRILREKRQH